MLDLQVADYRLLRRGHREGELQEHAGSTVSADSGARDRALKVCCTGQCDGEELEARRDVSVAVSFALQSLC